MYKDWVIKQKEQQKSTDSQGWMFVHTEKQKQIDSNETISKSDVKEHIDESYDITD